MESLGHELLMLMLNLSRMRDRDRIVRLFEEALAAAIPGVVVRRLAPGETTDGEVVELATPGADFGRMAVEDPSGLLPARERALYRNAIRMLAVLLENVSRAERLATENTRLDAAVAERTGELRRLADELEARVAERTAQLAAVNQELEAFAYSVSHDLQAPLRHMDGFLALARRRLGEPLRDDVREALDKVAGAEHRMRELITDLLSFSRMGRAEMAHEPVDLGELAREVIAALAPDAAGRDVRFSVAELPVVTGDRAMFRVVFTNLLSNALKFTRPRAPALIDVGCAPAPDGREHVLFVRDNGVGFDMQYADKLFGVFRRLHSAEEFEGTGVGLANVRRIVERHGGRAWAQATPGEGATFFFSIPRQTG